MTTTTDRPTRLKRAMKDKGYTLAGLADLLGDVSNEGVRNWQRGVHRPHRKYHARLEAFLGLPLDELMAPDNENDAR